jgi:hypothetical protein
MPGKDYTPDELYQKFRINQDKYNSYINNKNVHSMPYSVKELNTAVNNNYILLIVWFIITLFVLIITVFTLLDETSMNKYGIMLIILFLFYMFFYFTNNIFKII